MKAAFCTCVFNKEEIPSALSKLKEFGYDGVEFWDQFLSTADISALKKQMDDIKLETAQICPYFNVTGSSQELEETFKMAARYIEIAERLDTKLIRVFTGKKGSAQVDKETYQQAVEGLRTICDMGKAKHTVFVLETHPGSLMDTGPATQKLLQDVKRDNLKVNLQIPLDGGREDIFESAHRLGEHVFHLHAHNWIGGWPNVTFLNKGDYNFKKFIEILCSKGFDGYISIEHGTHNGTRDAFEVAKHEIEYLRNKIIGMI